MATFLLDTNHLSPALNKVSPLRDRILQACRKGDRFATCWPVLCELEAGIVNTKNPARNRRTLGDLLERIAIWPQDWPVVWKYGEIAKLLGQRGRVLSPVDVTLSAFALVESATLLTTDLDFAALPEIRVEDWRSGF
jgi:predicted nucleic acid-binding protein